MPLEPLRCKVCGGLLDANLKCQHCGTLHERKENTLQVIRVCPKHLIGYSSLNCPKCVEEQQKIIIYYQEQARLSTEREERERKERLKRIEEAKVKHQEWKRSNYPKLKKLGAVAFLCLVIGIAGLCLSTENYISHNVNTYSATTYVSIPSPITVLNGNELKVSLVDHYSQGVSISPVFGRGVSVYLNNGEPSNFLWADNGFADPAIDGLVFETIPFSLN